MVVERDLRSRMASRGGDEDDDEEHSNTTLGDFAHNTGPRHTGRDERGWGAGIKGEQETIHKDDDD